MKIISLQVDDAEVGILVNETFGLLLKGLDGLLVPPVGVIPYLIVMAPVGIEGCTCQLQRIRNEIKTDRGSARDH